MRKELFAKGGKQITKLLKRGKKERKGYRGAGNGREIRKVEAGAWAAHGRKGGGRSAKKKDRRRGGVNLLLFGLEREYGRDYLNKERELTTGGGSGEKEKKSGSEAYSIVV